MTIDKLVVKLEIEIPTVNEKIGFLQDDIKRYQGYLNSAYNLSTKNKLQREEKEEYISRLRRGQEFYRYMLKQVIDANQSPYYKGGRHTDRDGDYLSKDG